MTNEQMEEEIKALKEQIKELRRELASYQVTALGRIQTLEHHVAKIVGS